MSPIRILLLVVAVAAAFALGFLIRGSGGTAEHGLPAVGSESPEPQRWTCSMHPQIILPSNDQKCPICFMDLIPLEEGVASGASGELTLSSSAAALAGVATEPVQKRFVPKLVRLVGRIRPDEARTGRITARVAGRLDELHIDTTGQAIRAGDPVAEIYSPELYSAQAELQAAAKAAKKAGSAAGEEGILAGSAQDNLEAATERLRLWGMSGEQIEAIVNGGSLSDHLTVTAPVGGIVLERLASEGDYVKTGEVLFAMADLSRVWATLEAFESDVAGLREGQTVNFRTRAHPGRTFEGVVLFVDPVLDPRTRTAEVRVEVDNPGGLLKPGMLVEGNVEVLLDALGVPLTDIAGAEPPLVIPATAPLLTGARAVVYVLKPGEGDPVFEGRQVTLGPKVQDFYVVLAGLEPGEAVVTRGNFKIDSALQIQASPSMMTRPDDDPGPLEPAFEDVPSCFGEGLHTVLTPYYELQDALAADDDTGSAAAAGRVAAAAESLICDTGGMPSEAAGRWNRAVGQLRTAAAVTAGAGDLGARRKAFEPLSDRLWDSLAAFGTGTAEPVRRFHCPMAFDDRGAFWIQKGETTANPYYGNMMLRCGSQKDVLGGEPAPAEGAAHVH
jgi:Cu(I)/Ag(I) efflux system membrane fusion protein